LYLTRPRRFVVRLPPSLLTQAERRAFAPWLRSVIEDSGKSKTEFARAIGDESTARLNRYLNDGRIPTKGALWEIAREANVPYVAACLRAGHLEEIVEAVSAFVATFVKTNDRRWMASAFLVTFACFPRAEGGEIRPRPGGIARVADLLEMAFDEIRSRRDGGGRARRKTRPPLWREFGAVVRILRESRLDARDRRDIAGLILTNWAERFNSKMAAAMHVYLARLDETQNENPEALQRLLTKAGE
jgi:transcriptional regulator with XRE-family HTH domain